MGGVVGTPHRHYRVTDSTNARARELAAAGAPHGAVVTADEQTEGRGRQGRSWVAPAGKALLYSAIIRPLGERPLLPLAAGLAVCEAAEQLAPGIECRVKWPNDVLLSGRKLAGVLIEARPQDDWAVIGVGLNLTIEPEEFPPELRDSATSLSLTSGVTHRSAERQPTRFTAGCTAVMSGRLEHWLDVPLEEILEAWGERDALQGRQVSWGEGSPEGGSGVAEGVDDRGGLVVVVSGGERVVLDSGEVHLTV